MNFSTDEILISLKRLTGMSGRKFRRMMKYLRLYDKDAADEQNISKRGVPTYDSQHKVRPYLDCLVRAFQRNIKLGRYAAIDESMDKCTSRCAHKQFIPRKPIKEGLKYYYACDERGYIFNMNLHTKEVLPYDAEKGPLFSRAFMLMTGQNVPGGVSYLDEWRTVITDRLYSSVELAFQLYERKTFFCGTVIASRKGLPADICKDKMTKNMIKGRMVFRHADPLRYVNWYDSNVVKLLHTMIQYLEQFSVIKRRNRLTGELQEITVPNVIKFYQTYMRGVDMAYVISLYKLF